MTKIQKAYLRYSFYLVASLSLGIVFVLGLLLLLNASSTRAQTQPTVADVSPNTVVNDVEHVLTIQGSGFEDTPTVTVGAEPLLDVSYISTTTLTATLPSSFSVGNYTVTVTNPGGLSDSLPSGLTVQNPAPMLQGLSPDSGLYGQATVLTITGTHFISTPAVALGETPCPAVGYVSSTTLTATVPGGLLPGIYDLAVTNPGPGNPQDVLADAFTLYSPTPTMTEVDPGSAPNDLDSQVIIAGTNFVPTPTVTLDTVPLQDVTWVSSTRLSALIPWGMDEGTYSLTVTNPGPSAASGTLSDAFTVTQGIGVWNATELYGGNIDQIVINPLTPTTMYAIANDVGLFQTHDGGENWSFNVASIFVEDLAVDPTYPTRVYRVGYPHSGGWLYRSDDGGDSWLPITATFLVTQTSGRDCPARYRLYTTPGAVYASACGRGGGESGLIKSEDHGQTWEPLMNGITDTQVTELAFHPTDPLTMYLGTANGNIFISHNSGISWTFASKPLENIYHIAVSPFGDHEVWVATGRVWTGDPCGIVKSSNSELTAWDPLPEPVYSKCGSSLFLPPAAWGEVFSQTVFVEDCRTIDGGATWQPFGPGNSAAIRAVHPSDPDVIYFGHSSSSSGVHRTTNGGMTWELASQGLTGVFPWSLEVVPDQPDVVFVGTNVEAVFKGIGGGRAWRRLPIEYGGGSGGGSILVDPVTPTRVYAGAGHPTGGGVYISYDGGDTWPAFVPIDPPEVYSQCVQWVDTLLPIPGEPGVILAGVKHGPGEPCVPSRGSIYRSTDYGEHWDRVYPVQPQESNQFSDLAHDALISTTVSLCANIGETTPARKLVYNGGRRKDLLCLTNKLRKTNNSRNKSKKSSRPGFPIRKWCPRPNADSLLPNTSCASFEKRMPAPSRDRSDHCCDAKGCTRPTCPNGDNSGRMDSYKPSLPRNEAASLKTHR